jgi:hypothetical protein
MYNVSDISLSSIKTNCHHTTEKFFSVAKNARQSIHQTCQAGQQLKKNGEYLDRLCIR